ncbi:hypothetical protein PO124_33830 [Bacillus licheniformis]|nr:hypothetical protein [Bacillus licheniformis]
MKEGVTARLTDSLETALRLGEGRVIIDVIGQEELLFSEHHACPHCGFQLGNWSRGCFLSTARSAHVRAATASGPSWKSM